MEVYCIHGNGRNSKTSGCPPNLETAVTFLLFYSGHSAVPHAQHSCAALWRHYLLQQDPLSPLAFGFAQNMLDLAPRTMHQNVKLVYLNAVSVEHLF